MVSLCRIRPNSPAQIGYRESITMNPMSIEVASCSDKGLVREVNQDSIAAFPESGLVVLADGMGGHNAGEVASRVAVETVTHNLLHAPLFDAQAMVAAVEAANDAIFAGVQQMPEYQGMATTLVVAFFQDGKILFTHVGDSRIYRLRKGVLAPLTRTVPLNAPTSLWQMLSEPSSRVRILMLGFGLMLFSITYALKILCQAESMLVPH